MKKVSLILAVLLFTLTVPTWAVVTIVCEQVGSSDDVLVSYLVSEDEPNKVRAFALDITVDNGVISDVNDNVSSWYTIYPGSIVIEDGVVVDAGSAVADPNDHPDTQPGIDSNGVTVEMGALYSPPIDPCGPPKNNGGQPVPLLRFTNTVAGGNTTVTITENESRGGVVMTDPNADPCVPPCTCQIIRECFPQCRASEYAQWASASANKPLCWCDPYVRQCHGDADNIKEYIKGKGYYYVHFKDLNVLAAAWDVREPPEGPGMAWPSPLICADFNRGVPEYIKGKGYYRVHFKDLNILAAYWDVREAPEGPGIPPDCLDCP